MCVKIIEFLQLLIILLKEFSHISGTIQPSISDEEKTKSQFYDTEVQITNEQKARPEMEYLNILASGNNTDGSMIWQIEEGETVFTKIKSYEEFNTEKTYVIMLLKKSNNMSEPWMPMVDIYYWIGSKSIEAEIIDAASHAVELDYEFNSIVRVHREAEGQESHSFLSIFDELKSQNDSMSDEKDDEISKMMFWINDRTVIRFNEINLSHVRYTREKHDCLVLNSDRAVYVYCGSKASKRLQKIAGEFANIIQENRRQKVETIKIFRDNKPISDLSPEDKHTIDLFLEEFKSNTATITKEEVSSKEWQAVLDEKDTGEQDNKISITRIGYGEDEEKVVEVSLDGKNGPTPSFRTDECYVVDIDHDIGLFIWIGKNSERGVRQASAKKAEKMLKEKNYKYTTPIIFADETSINIPPEVDFRDIIRFTKIAKLPISWVLKSHTTDNETFSDDSLFTKME